MKRKGFTLVELLAVIAILAILVIIALPNVLKMYNNAKKNSFLTEAKTVYSEVSKKYITESMKGNKLSYINFDDETKLEMSGEKIKYCINLNSDGSVKNMKVTNGVYYIETGSDITKLSIKDILEGDYNKFSCKSVSVETDSNNCVISKHGKETLISNMITKEKCVNYDNTNSEYVSTDAGINLNEKSSDTNGKGLYLYSKTSNDENPIYYYRGDVDNNYVLLNNHCFQIVRTTDTGGIKLIYSGKSTNGKCNAISKDKAGIDAVAFNYQGSLTDSLYMYGTSYKTNEKLISDLTSSKIIFGNDVTYNNTTNEYTLLDIKTVEAGQFEANYNDISKKYHYTCFSDSTTCTNVSYIVFFDSYAASNKVRYLNLSNGKNIDTAYNEMLDITSNTKNLNNSNAKAKIDDWYENNGFIEFTNILEDTVWCNRISLYQKNGWDKDGNGQDALYFREAREWNYSFDCSQKYGFTVSSDKGNKLLKYPVAMLTADEMVFAGATVWEGNDNYYLYHSSEENYYFWTMTPFYYTYTGVGIFMSVDSSKGKGNLDTRPSFYGASGFTIRPSISLKKGIAISGGEGTKDNPYIIKTN